MRLFVHPDSSHLQLTIRGAGDEHALECDAWERTRRAKKAQSLGQNRGCERYRNRDQRFRELRADPWIASGGHR